MLNTEALIYLLRENLVHLKQLFNKDRSAFAVSCDNPSWHRRPILTMQHPSVLHQARRLCNFQRALFYAYRLAHITYILKDPLILRSEV